MEPEHEAFNMAFHWEFVISALKRIKRITAELTLLKRVYTVKAAL